MGGEGREKMAGRICVVVLGVLLAAPVRGDLFGISTSNSVVSFDGTTLSSRDASTTLVHLFRNAPPVGSAILLPGLWGTGAEGLELSMTISDITAGEAIGSGAFELTDIHGDSISGSVDGLWSRDGGRGIFSGTLSGVTFASVTDSDFTGHLDSTALMTFEPAASWEGFTTIITAEGTWFQTAGGAPNIYVDMDSIPGTSLEMRVVPVPAPAALLLCLLGLGGAGLKVGKYL